MISPKQPWQWSIRTLLILTTVAALGLALLRTVIVYSSQVIALVVILAIPVLMLTMVMHMAMLGFSRAAAMLPTFSRKSRRADSVQH